MCNNYLIQYFVKIAPLHYSCNIHLIQKTEEDRKFMAKVMFLFIKFAINHFSDRLKNIVIIFEDYMIVVMKLSSNNLDFPQCFICLQPRLGQM